MIALQSSKEEWWEMHKVGVGGEGLTTATWDHPREIKPCHNAIGTISPEKLGFIEGPMSG